MPTFANPTLKVSFVLPERLSLGAYDRYQIAMAKGSGVELTQARFNALVFGAAVEAGLVSEWQCDSMPTLPPPDVNAVDAVVVIFCGQTIAEWVRAQVTVPKA